MSIRGEQVLFHEGGDEFRVDTSALDNVPGGIAYRNSTSMDDKAVDNAFAKEGSTVRGEAARDGWLKTTRTVSEGVKEVAKPRRHSVCPGTLGAVAPGPPPTAPPPPVAVIPQVIRMMVPVPVAVVPPVPQATIPAPLPVAIPGMWGGVRKNRRLVITNPSTGEEVGPAPYAAWKRQSSDQPSQGRRIHTRDPEEQLRQERRIRIRDPETGEEVVPGAQSHGSDKDDEEVDWYFENPLGGFWDWPLSRLEKQLRVQLLREAELIDEVEELRGKQEEA